MKIYLNTPPAFEYVNHVLHGDCLEIMPKIPDGVYDMILCDLPYGTTQNKWDSVIDLNLLWKQYNRVLKENGAVVLTAQIPFNITLGLSNLSRLKYEWIWNKSKPTGHLNAKKMPLKAHENILVFYKHPPAYNPQGLIFLEDPKLRHGGDNGTNYGYSEEDSIQEYTNYPRSILSFGSVHAPIHPTQKPVDLFEYLISTYTNEGDLVLDNCAGSGTTGEAAINTGRNFTLIEKDEDYFKKILNRLNDL